LATITEPPRTNAIRAPPGDHAGLDSASALVVSRRAPVPSAFATAMFPVSEKRER
jgi:hypothetical protein